MVRGDGGGGGRRRGGGGMIRLLHYFVLDLLIHIFGTPRTVFHREPGPGLGGPHQRIDDGRTFRGGQGRTRIRSIAAAVMINRTIIGRHALN